jgi:hypothetical protein
MVPSDAVKLERDKILLIKFDYNGKSEKLENQCQPTVTTVYPVKKDLNCL